MTVAHVDEPSGWTDGTRATHLDGQPLGRLDPADPLVSWSQAVRARVGDGPIALRGARDQLEGEVLRVHGRLIEKAALRPRRRSGPEGSPVTALARRLAAAERAALEDGAELPLPRLCDAYGLDGASRDVLLLAVARAVSPGTGPLVASAQGDPHKTHPTVSFAANWRHDGPALCVYPHDLLGPEAPLVRHGLVRLVRDPDDAAGLSIDPVVVASEAVAALLSGRPGLAPPLGRVASVVRHPVTLLDVVVGQEARRALEMLALGVGRYAAQEERGLLALLSGEHGVGKSRAAQAVAGTAGRPLVRVSLPRLAAQPDAHELLDEAFVQAALLGAILCLEDVEALLHERGAAFEAIVAGAARRPGLTLLTASSPEQLTPALAGHLVAHVQLGRPDAGMREQLWEAHLPARVPLDGDPRLRALAGRYDLSGAQIRQAVAAGRLGALAGREARPLGAEDLRRAAHGQMEAGLTAAPPPADGRKGLDSIVLSDKTRAQIEELVAAARAHSEVLNDWGFGQRLASGKGIVALFSGEPGTGKTLCAGLVANELGRRLQVVSLPQVMSKWIGETEKNIARIFRRARALDTVLFFDEADALFAKRVEVERTNDRYSNMQVDHLLQEIDAFEGVVILTSNLSKSIDSAFKRRIGFHVEFEVPDQAQRAQIWRALLPPQAPLADDVDFDELARCYELPGGHIKNILLRSAYRARAAGRPLDMRLLAEVGEEECRAAGKLMRTDQMLLRRLTQPTEEAQP